LRRALWSGAVARGALIVPRTNGLIRQPGQEHWTGEVLWGDDFNHAERAAWFADEERAYFHEYASKAGYEYQYHEVNRQLGFDHLPPGRRFQNVLGLGSAYGDEFAPIADRIDHAIIVESTASYREQRVSPFSIDWRTASPTGDLPLAASEVDLALCLGVLHHMPNVSHVLGELGRVLAHDGFALVREPIVSMGDWRTSRSGLTPRERGIPYDLLRQFCADASLEIVRQSVCFFPGTQLLARVFRQDRFSKPWLVRADAKMASATLRNYSYHATGRIAKIRPTAAFLVLRRV
jgi:SAM-dependent methyltransferase